MSTYDDIPKINALHAEQQLVQQALTNLAVGGTMSLFTIGALVTAPGPTPTPAPTPMIGPPPDPEPARPMTPVNITVTQEMPPNIMNQIQRWLEDQMQRINDDLAELGVTDTPAPPTMTTPLPAK
jgi:hypothetical protein